MDVVEGDVVDVALADHHDNGVLILIVDNAQFDLGLGALGHRRFEDSVKHGFLSHVDDDGGCVWAAPAVVVGHDSLGVTNRTQVEGSVWVYHIQVNLGNRQRMIHLGVKFQKRCL